MDEIIRALQLKEELDQLRPIGKEQEAIVMQKFRLDWNYHSNHLEGNSLTYGETKALIMFGITAQGKPLKDHFEMTGHDEAIKWVEDVVKGDLPLTEHFIRQLHELLLKESYEVDAITPEGLPTKKRVTVGQYKTTPNHVKTKTGEIFRFATPEETPAQMHELMDWYKEKSEEKDVNPIILAAEFHYKFIRIHPFDDGNGRTVRILMNFILMKFAYPPVIIKAEDKANYLSVLQQADAGLIESFVNYIAANLVRSLEIMIAGAKGESIEEPYDLDKELALLEQKLKTIGEKTVRPKSADSILEVYDKSINILYKEFKLSCEKFEKFYKETKVELIIDNRVLKAYKNEDINDYENLVKESINYIKMRGNFNQLHYMGFGEFNYMSEIIVSFKSLYYSCSLSGNIGVIEKGYGEQLTNEDILKLVKLETNRHKEFIEKKLEQNK